MPPPKLEELQAMKTVPAASPDELLQLLGRLPREALAQLPPWMLASLQTGQDLLSFTPQGALEKAGSQLEGSALDALGIGQVGRDRLEGAKTLAGGAVMGGLGSAARTAGMLKNMPVNMPKAPPRGPRQASAFDISSTPGSGPSFGGGRAPMRRPEPSQISDPIGTNPGLSAVRPKEWSRPAGEAPMPTANQRMGTASGPMVPPQEATRAIPRALVPYNPPKPPMAQRSMVPHESPLQMKAEIMPPRVPGSSPGMPPQLPSPAAGPVASGARPSVQAPGSRPGLGTFGKAAGLGLATGAGAGAISELGSKPSGAAVSPFLPNPEREAPLDTSPMTSIQGGDTLSGLAQSAGQKWTPELAENITRMNPGRFSDPGSLDRIDVGESLALPFDVNRSAPGPMDEASKKRALDELFASVRGSMPKPGAGAAREAFMKSKRHL